MARVVIGMSGGVDSSIAAWLLKQEGHEVSAVSFLLRNGSESGACCSRQGIESAGEMSEALGIPLHAVDMTEEFEEKVVRPFVDAYMEGITPNPCILCNRHIKFPGLLRAAAGENAEYIATGHYARVQRHGNGPLCLLLKGIDQRKDQSYVLHFLGQAELCRLILPLGGRKKEDVRRHASELNLPAAIRPESQEICFVEERNYLAFIEERRLTGTPGPIRNQEGRIIGIHEGIHRYTIGQRKRLGIYHPEPLYVTKVETESNTLFVGPRSSAEQREFAVESVNWIVRNEVFPLRCAVRVRSTMEEKPASVCAAGGDHSKVNVVFEDAQWAPAPGQSAVFYRGDAVLGGGTIVRK
jgi:tRNA-uridine 2-sulfurtransferase